MSTSGGHMDLESNVPINPQSRVYRIWVGLILVLAFISAWISSIQFAFYDVKLPSLMIYLDLGHLVFFIDVFIQILVADTKDQKLSYIFFSWPNILGCIPWIFIYHVIGRFKVLKWFVVSRIFRLYKVCGLFSKMEPNSWLSFLSSKPMKTLVVMLILSHVGGCVYFYMAISMSPSKKGHTWIGSLEMGEQSYSDFRNMTLVKLYIASFYTGFMTISTAGYAAVNEIEMIFTILLMSVWFFLSGYVTGERPIKKQNSDEDNDSNFAVSPQQLSENGRNKRKKRRKRKWSQMDVMVEVGQPTDEKRDINEQNSSGKTALHYAAIEGNVGNADILIKLGAKIDPIDKVGYTPLYDAMKGRQATMASFLVDKGAKLMTEQAGSFLVSAVATNDIEHVKWLQELGMNLDIRDKKNNSLLHFASKSSSQDMVKFLAETLYDIPQDDVAVNQ